MFVDFSLSHHSMIGNLQHTLLFRIRTEIIFDFVVRTRVLTRTFRVLDLHIRLKDSREEDEER